VTPIRHAALCAPPLFALFVLGCAGDDTNPPAPDSGSSGVQDGSATDATVSPPQIDGGGGDGASSVAADGGSPVTVAVVDSNGSPEANVTVVFGDATGAVLGVGVTDATGAVSGLVSAGGEVTVLLGTTSTPTLVTTFGVEPGDQLSAIDVSGSQASFIETISVTALPASPPDDDAGITFLLNAGTCGATGASPPLAFEVYASPPPCVVAGAFPLLLVDQDLAGNPLAFAFQKSNAALADAGALSLSMAGAAWATPTQESLVVSNAPSGFEPPNYVFTEVAGGVPSTAPPSALDGGVAFSVHPGYADFVQTEVNVQLGMPPGDDGGVSAYVFAAMAQRSATAPSALALDMSQIPPFLEVASLDSSNAARPVVSWTGAAPLANADGVLAVVSWSGGSWTFVVPPGQSSARAPALPTSSSAWAPGPGASFGPVVVSIVQATFWSDYAAFRAAPAALVTQSLIDLNGCVGTNGSCVPPLPADGTFSMSAYVAAP
jgi:hypothetical protein